MSAQLLPPNVEASKMLEAALQQMDGIIAGTQLELASIPDRSVSPTLSVAELAEKLRQAVQTPQDEGEVEELAEDTRNFLLEWLKGQPGKEVWV
ncbi:liprin-beta-1-like [Panulirus ornatus]|uniref:liprin-beta-1-like n=1 Tax=Panulirus ornatus TaxID=150431 RepID=UPI003A88C311